MYGIPTRAEGGGRVVRRRRISVYRVFVAACGQGEARARWLVGRTLSLWMRLGIVVRLNNQIGSEDYAQTCYRHDRRRRYRRDAGSRPGPADRGYAPEIGRAHV